MGKQVATHGGHTGESGDSLAFDEFQRSGRVPLVQKHHGSTNERGRMQNTVVGRHVKERCRGHGDHRGSRSAGVRWRRFVASSHGLGLRQRSSGGHERDVHHVVDRPAMRELRPFGKPRGARRVEDRDVVIGIDRGVGQRVWGRAGVDDIGPVVGTVGKWHVTAHHQEMEGQVGANLVENRDCQGRPLTVDDEHLGLGVFEAVGHLGRGPPRVHADQRSAQRCHRPVRHHPLGVVAH